MAIRGSVAIRTETFKAQLDGLKEEYPQIEDPIAELEEFLCLDYDLPEIRVDPDSAPNVYAIKVDYPPKGSEGRSRFLVTYHGTDPKPSLRDPYRTITLLTITERTQR